MTSIQYAEIDDDNLSRMFFLQRNLQTRLGFDLDEFDQDFMNLMFIAMVTECAEMIEETKWKPWKKSQECDYEKLREEVVDIWHFLINITIMAGMDAKELYDAFVRKNVVNNRRQDNGY